MREKLVSRRAYDEADADFDGQFYASPVLYVDLPNRLVNVASRRARAVPAPAARRRLTRHNTTITVSVSTTLHVIRATAVRGIDGHSHRSTRRLQRRIHTRSPPPLPQYRVSPSGAEQYTSAGEFPIVGLGRGSRRGVREA